MTRFLSLLALLTLVGFPIHASAQQTPGDARADLELCGSLDAIALQLRNFVLDFEVSDSIYRDFSGDGLPEVGALALIEAIACDTGDTLTDIVDFSSSTNDTYQTNLATLRTEDDAALLAPYENAIAALMLVSEDMNNAISDILADNGIILRNTYFFLEVGDVRNVNNPYAGEADLDLDTATNATEYFNTIRRGQLDLVDFVEYAFDPTRDGSDLSAGGGGSSQLCLIATAALGTPMAAELGSIRTFRDTFMTTNPVGTALSDVYYRISPAGARWTQSHPVNAALVRGITLPFIFVLHNPTSVFLVGFAMLTVFGAVRRFRAREKLSAN